MHESAVVEPRVFRLPRRALIAVAALCTVAAGVLVWLLTRVPPPAHARNIGARLELAAGDVGVTEGTTPSSKSLSGTPLAVGSHIATGKGSRALVRTGDGAAVFLRGETEIALGDHGIILEHGEVWLDAPHMDAEAIEFSLGDHVVSASDAGLSIKRDKDDVTVYVARGLSILRSPGGRVEINAGEQGTVKGKTAPKIEAVAFWQDWTGGMGDTRSAHGNGGSGSGRIYGLDPNASFGMPATKLGIAQQAVKAVIRDGIAETEVDQTFSNPSGQQIEGWYWFTVPATATVTSFALDTDGVLVEGEVIEKRDAAARYEAAIRKQNDPALLEWVDGRTYRARIFPIPASGTRRVVLRYMELLPMVEGKTRYVYPMRSDDPPRFDEFSLAVDLGVEGPQMQVATSLDARVEAGGRSVSMRRSGYVPRADFQLELASGPNAKKSAPARAWRFEAGSNKADYVMMRYVPQIDFSALPPATGELVVVVDTSAGGDESARQLRNATAEAILRALSDQDKFALIALDVAPTVVYPPQGLAQASESEIAKALEKLSDHATGGATDLGSMFEPALERLHGTDQPAIVYVGDGAPTSGETTADALLDRLRRSLSGARARLFCVGVGSDAHHDLLMQLTRAGGGQYLRIDEAEQATGQALRLTSAIKTPTITEIEVDLGAGLDQPFYSSTGKLSRGEELFLLARTHHPLPQKVKIKGRAGGATFNVEYPLAVESGVTTSLVPRLWAAEYVRRLLGSGTTPDDNRSKVLDLGIDYGLMTPYTSILALDSDAAYARQGIVRKRSKLRGERLTELTSDSQEKQLAELYRPGFSSTVMGCDAKSRSAPTGVSMEEPASGTRAKGEEGSMGTPTPVNQANAAPPAPPQPVMAMDDAPPADPAAAKEAEASGMFGLIGASGGGGSAPGNSPKAASARGSAPARPQAVAPDMPPTTVAPHANFQAGKDGFAGKKGDARDEKKPVEDERQKNAKLLIERAQQRWTAIRRAPLARCSDSASRPLSERVVLWQKRMKRSALANELVAQYEGARAACELPDWRDQAALLELLQQRVTTEQGAEFVLEHFAGETDAQRFVARSILRRTVDLRLAAAVSRVLFGSTVDWARVDRDLLDTEKPEARLLKLKTAMLLAPGDPAGDVRLVRLLAETNDRSGAIAYGRRLRDRGFLTPTLAQQLGDVLSAAGEKDEALRTYSEVVEFDGNNPESRRVLGDIYLRQGWYAAAYRQYKTLTDLDPKGAFGRLRLASAAAGAGRIDEALRIEREVATGEGSPGPEDPRYFARLWSAARLGALLNDPQAAGGNAAKEGIARKIKELSLFSGPGTLALVTWDDLEAQASLVASDDKKETLPGETTDAGKTGLYAMLLRSDAWEKTKWAVRWKSDPPGRAMRFSLLRITWDGKAFSVAVQKGELKAGDRQTEI